MASDPDSGFARGAEVNAELRRRADDRWAAFQEARRDLAEVMSDDELAEFGFNVQELDRKP